MIPKYALRISLVMYWVILNIFPEQGTHPPIEPQDYSTYLPSVQTGASFKILWISACDPRYDPPPCPTGSLNALTQFHETIGWLNAKIDYRLPQSISDLNGYEVVIANYCSDIYAKKLTPLIESYVTGGGSVVVMGDNFCIVGSWPNGKNFSAADAANVLTEAKGIHFTADDTVSSQWSDTILPHPITLGVTKIYASRHAYLDISAPSQKVVGMNTKGFIGVYDQEGTLVAIPHVGFQWGNTVGQVASSDNFKLWREMLRWLADQSLMKRAPSDPH